MTIVILRSNNLVVQCKEDEVNEKSSESMANIS
jgi:hypothetical protein